MGKYHQPTSGSWGTQPRFVLHRSSPKVCTSGGARCSSQGGETNNTEGTIHCNCCFLQVVQDIEDHFGKKREFLVYEMGLYPPKSPGCTIKHDFNRYRYTYEYIQNLEKPQDVHPISHISLFGKERHWHWTFSFKSEYENKKILTRSKIEASTKLQIVNVRSFWVAPQTALKKHLKSRVCGHVILW